MTGGITLYNRENQLADLGYQIPVSENFVHANGTDFWYVEAGVGTPLLLLHGGLVSNGPLWTGHKFSWAGHIAGFAKHFRVIALDTRGHGRTPNPLGTLSYQLYADDTLAVVDALKLDRPLIAGFSDGGTSATILGMVAPDVPRALVNFGGYQTFDPNRNASTYRRTRMALGGSLDATRPDYPQFATKQADLQRHIDDYEPTQGVGYFQRYIEQIFEFWTKPMSYTYSDFPRITAPTLLLVGDRDETSAVDDAVDLYHGLPSGELGIIPGASHEVTTLACDIILGFLLRHSE